MYGVINNALRDMVIRDAGLEVWRTIASRAGHTADAFLSMETYNDAATYALVASAAQTLERSPDACLEAFGRFWILEAAPQAYGEILDATGGGMIEFIGNVNALHDRITTSFPRYVPPEFHLEELGAERYDLHYLSTRKGLAAFVRGLIHGLSERFNHPVGLEGQRSLPAEPGEHVVFTLDVSRR